MKPYIYTKYNNIHIINLNKTIKLFNIAINKLKLLQKKKKKILFIGTKKSASKIIKKTAIICKQFYINKR